MLDTSKVNDTEVCDQVIIYRVKKKNNPCNVQNVKENKKYKTIKKKKKMLLC